MCAGALLPTQKYRLKDVVFGSHWCFVRVKQDDHSGYLFIAKSLIALPGYRLGYTFFFDKLSKKSEYFDHKFIFKMWLNIRNFKAFVSKGH
jgi:hypothetical protein